MLAALSPFSLILFGASGHLAKIKIFPALYFLALKKRLPKEFSIVGYARTAMDDATFRAQFAESVHIHVPEVREDVLDALLTHVHYQQGQYDVAGDFRALSERLTLLEGQKEAVRIAYLSIPPSAFGSVLMHLCAGNVHDTTPLHPFRCIVEKPVGESLMSFKLIRDQIYRCFTPKEVYFLDHYLGKEAVRNVYYLRYANPVIERLLKNTLISHVQITASEDHGLENRAGYFDAVGTFRDMFQSHLLQIAALLTMRLLSGSEAFKAVRLEALRALYLPPVNDLSHIVLQGQYTQSSQKEKKMIGYTQEAGVAPASHTPTFAVMKVMSRSPRWEGVPLFLRSGKRMARKETRISIAFQESLLIGQGFTNNRLDIILQGEAGLKFHLQTKLGGSEPNFRPLVMEDPLVCMGDCLVEHSLLLLEAINGHQQWFVDPDEIQTCWQLIDPLQKYLTDPTTPLFLYEAGTNGPREADDFIAQNGFSWF